MRSYTVPELLEMQLKSHIEKKKLEDMSDFGLNVFLVMSSSYLHAVSGIFNSDYVT